MKLSQTITDLQTQVTTLQTQVTTLTEAATKHGNDISVKDARIAELEGQVNTLTGEKTSLSEQVTALTGEKTSLTEKVTALEGEKTGLATQVTTLTAEVATEKAKNKNVDETADAKARETAARTGTNLPAKQPGAGDQTTDDAGKATGTVRERLNSFWKIRE